MSARCTCNLATDWGCAAHPNGPDAAPQAAPSVAAPDESASELALRSLASWLGVGGYNAPTVDAAVFEAKIREGVTIYSQLHGLAARDLAEQVLHMDLVTDRGIRARELARRVLGLVPPAALPLPAVVQADDKAFRKHQQERMDAARQHDDEQAKGSLVHPAAPSSPSAQARPLVQEQGESGQGELPVRAEMENTRETIRSLANAVSDAERDGRAAVVAAYENAIRIVERKLVIHPKRADIVTTLRAAMSAPGGGGRA